MTQVLSRSTLDLNPEIPLGFLHPLDVSTELSQGQPRVEGAGSRAGWCGTFIRNALMVPPCEVLLKHLFRTKAGVISNYSSHNQQARVVATTKKTAELDSDR